MRHVLWLWLIPLLAGAQPAFRVHDIRQTADTTPQPGSDPQGLTALNGGVVFSALRGQEREPWFSDGTAAGTVQLVDAWPGTSSSAPRNFTRVGNRAFFVGDVGSFKVDDALFVTDGTPEGTRRLRKVSYANHLSAVGSTLFFTAQDGDGVGYAVWRSDGTPEGTIPLVPVSGSSESANATAAVDANGTAFFAASGSSGWELWKSDGTPAGTVRVHVFIYGNIAGLTAVGSTVFFAATDYFNGVELWKSDGTPEGTVMVKNINAGMANSQPAGLTRVGSTLLFFAQDGVNGYEPWKSDGTPEGTVMVADLRPGSGGSVSDTSKHGIRAVVGATLYFIASVDTTGSRLWKTDGTAAGTSRITSPAGYTFSPASIAAAGASVYFTSYTGGTGGEALWKTDGTTAGTVAVKPLPAGTTVIPAWNLFTGSGERLFFIGRTDAAGMELWTSDGTDAGTVPTRDIHRRVTSSEPQKGVALGNLLLFAANDGASGVELWRTDGTAGGTALVRDIRTGTASSSPTQLTRMGSAVYFVADDGTSGAELWKTDGTAAGTVRVRDLRSGTTGSSPGGLTAWGQHLYFIANDGTRGAELWRTNGTDLGTELVADIRAGTGSGAYSSIQPIVAGGWLYFAGNDGTTGWELWRTNGTAAGTMLVRDARPGTTSLAQYDFFTLASAGDRVFIGVDSASHSELWRSDGTAVGTQQLGAFSAESSLNTMVEYKGDLFFIADGHQLWRSDGTPLGTYLVKDWNPSAAPRWYEGGLRVVGSTLFFSADDGAYGSELWTSDGTEAGTTRLTDLMPGPGSSVMGPLIAGQRLLWFAGGDTASGVELWQTDGTVQGTRRVHDIASGATSSNPGPVAVAGGKMYFAATDGDGDRELWAFAVDSTPPRIEPRLVGTLGQAGWYTSDVRVSFSVTDDESLVEETDVCPAFTLSADTSGRTFTCTAASWGGSATGSVTVKRDATAPVLSCPAPVQVEATGPEGTQAFFNTPEARDAMDPAPTVQTSIASGTRLDMGRTGVTVTARDVAGNTGTCELVLVVRDSTPPILQCPVSVEVQATAAEGATVDFSVQALDAVDASPSVEYSHAPGSRFPVGETQVTVTATDDSGNSMSCAFPVRVTRVPGSGGGGGGGPVPDGPSGPPPEESGCGCASTANAPLAVHALLLWVAFSVLRRRARA